ncbi:uncharacterized protein LOC111406721 [Olea europaea var. sylvestris]|uniref:uncharacterized protein LOC111406721 n=1 Tax=Olea europaea var. sylvestris TaxID=158386 RepID=UPI000C1D191B|nr:uncharacterized protein LOC111406721 [Olea europaea var. sylvestris]
MGNVVGSFFSGFSQVIGKLLGHPLDFLAGKSCDTVCHSTWDFTCYIENFCIAQLLKLAMVATLFYFVLLFFYLSYKLGICQCICHTLCRTTWACFATCFSTLDFCCTYLCFKLKSVKRTRRRQRRDIEKELSTSTSEEDYEESFSRQQPKNLKDRRSLSHRRRNYKQEHLRRALRPNSHRANLGISRNSMHRQTRNTYGSDHVSPVHHIHVITRSSKFARQGSRHKGKVHHRRM